MINMSNELFDNKIKERIKNEINYVPDGINEKINDSVKRLEKEESI